MNFMRTAMLLAALTAIFMGVGYLVGGAGGMIVAFLVAAGMNLFAYWNADKMVLVDERRPRGRRAHRARVLRHRPRPCARRPGCRCRGSMSSTIPQPNAFATGRNPENAAVAATTGLLSALSREEIAGRDGARARPREEPRHADS